MRIFDRKTQQVDIPIGPGNDGEQVNLPEPAAEAEHGQTIKCVEPPQDKLTMGQAQTRATTADLVAALVDRLKDDSRATAEDTEQSILQAVAAVTQTVTGLRQDLAAYVTQRDQADQELLGQLADMRTEQRQIRAVLDSLNSVNDQSHAALAREPAIRAMIAVDEQLTRVLTAVADEHRAVIVGQRSNLRQTLDQLGVRAIEPPHGTAFDPNRHRSSSTSAQTSDATLYEQVASLTRTGWEMSDGRLLAPAEVTVYDYTPPILDPIPANQHKENEVDCPQPAPAAGPRATAGSGGPSAEQAPAQSSPLASPARSGQPAAPAAEQQDKNLDTEL